ncbi:MAG: MOSC N-terminal beta barrel domain-containing protein [Gaiellales bacterium]
MDAARVTSISIAPVKGLGLRHPDAVELTARGVVENRRLHIVDGTGRLVNGKTRITLIKISSTLDLAAGTLVLRFPEGDEVAGALELGAPETTIFFGRPVDGRAIEGPFAGALSDWAGTELRLVMSDEIGAGSDRGDEGSVSIISAASITDVAQHGGADGLDARRFRMLFEVDGVSPYDEDSWIGRDVRIGDAIVRPLGNVGRCVITTCHPDTAERDFDTLGVLASYRREIETTEPLPLGVAGAVVQPGRVRLGDAVTAV